ncbi:MAG: hypothetical protein BZ151_06285 [Desulfobacca sp. 4484_104]|nr:MAG: hypothetical protein BZ151_06285 [Desulfobacca sp. 4484_104]RLA90980.1 MAG: hypothetical protein DRG58_00400 [Deltaproteobacteria bacterium]
MSIRYLAQELYQAERKVEHLEKELAALGTQPAAARVQLEADLLLAKKARQHYKALLDAKKSPPPWRTGFHS